MTLEVNKTALAELANAVSKPIAGLMLLQYKSAVVFSEIDARIRDSIVPRPLHEVYYRTSSEGGREGSPAEVTLTIERLADPSVPVILLRPILGESEVDGDYARAEFWKILNFQRERLGAVSAQVLVCLDTDQEKYARAHAPDLVSWCIPKFVFSGSRESPLALSPTANPSDHLDLPEASPMLVWRLFDQAWKDIVRSKRAVTEGDVAKVAIPLIRSAIIRGDYDAARETLRELGVPTGVRPGIRAQWLELRGDVKEASGDLAGARTDFQEALDVFQAELANDPTSVRARRNVSIAHNRLGQNAMTSGDWSTAEREFHEALRLRRELVEHEPANFGLRRDLSLTINLVGSIFEKRGEWGVAIRHYEEALALRKALTESDPSSLNAIRDLEVSHMIVGQGYLETGFYSDAIGHFKEALRLAELVSGAFPTRQFPEDLSLQRDIANANERLFDAYLATGDIARAEHYLGKSHAIRRRLTTDNARNPIWKRDLSIALFKNAELHGARAQWSEALEALEESHRLARELTELSPENAQFVRDLIISHNRRYEVYRTMRNEAAAVRERDAALHLLNGMGFDRVNQDHHLAELWRRLSGNESPSAEQPRVPRVDDGSRGGSHETPPSGTQSPTKDEPRTDPVPGRPSSRGGGSDA
jgi:tetratricopeptide (TPR) repeat protein